MTYRNTKLFTMMMATVLATSMSANAETVQYTIDSNLSTLTLDGYVDTGTTIGFAEQSSGSLSTSYSGVISGDLVGSTLTFSGGSTIDADLNSASTIYGDFDPLASLTGSGALEDNYGIQDQYGGAFFHFAIRDVLVDFISGSATDGAATSGLEIDFLQGIADILNQGSFSYQSIVGVSGFNTSTDPFEINNNATTETITIPVAVSFSFLSGSNTVNMTITGQIVASRDVASVVPTPAALPAGLALLGLVTVRRRRR